MMSEGRKRSRKSKLEVRSEEIEEIKVLQKATLPTFLRPKSTIFDHTYSLKDAPTSVPLSSIQLSVKVEVEEFDESIMKDDKSDSTMSINRPSQLNSSKKGYPSSIRVFYVDLTKMFKIADHVIWSSTNPADKYLSIEMRNIWGRVLKPEEDKDPYNSLIQRALQSWGLGLINGRVWRESPIFYQCHLCNIAWWHLDPFRQHIRGHNLTLLKVYHQENYHESILIASYRYCEKTLYIPCEGNCYRCGKSFDFHVKTNHLLYSCPDCSEIFPTCSMMRNHQVCLNKEKIECPEYLKCQVCHVQFSNTLDLKTHMTSSHIVRSDVPSPFSFKTCGVCQKRYHHFYTHMCTQSSMNSVCSHCYRRFPTKTLADFHMVMGEKNYRCKLCDTVLVKKCMETEHMLMHTDKFKMAYKCINAVCPPTQLFPDEKSMRLHKARYHQQKYDKRRAYYELVLVPAKCFKTIVELYPEDSVCDATTASKVSDLVVEENPAPNEDLDMITNDEQTDMEIIQENISIKQEMQSLPEPDADSQDLEEMDYEEMLSKVFKVSDSVLHSQPFVRPAVVEEIKIKTEPVDEDFEKLIDDQNNPITIKEEPLEIDGEVEIDEYSYDMMDIKTEPEDYAIGHNDNVTAVKTEPKAVKTEPKAVKTEPKPVKMTLVEATELKIMDSSSSTTVLPKPQNKSRLPVKILIRTCPRKQLKKGAGLTKNLNGVIKTEHVMDRDQIVDLKPNGLTEPTLQPLKVTDVIASHSNTMKNDTDSLANELTVQTKKQPSSKLGERRAKQYAFIEKLKQNGLIEKTPLQRKLLALKKTFQPPKIVKKRKVDKHGIREERIYTCNKCGFQSKHKLYRLHMDSNCDLSTSTIIDKFACTKCSYSFSTLKMYLIHFHKHGYDPLHCPACNLKFEQLKDLIPHFQKHVRQNYVNYWMINKKLDVPTIKQQRCQICRKTVTPDEFFTHWESHLKLVAMVKPEPEKNELGPDETPIVNPKALQPNMLKMAVDQLRSMMREKECYVCLRKFTRRNDCKRHLIEHLLLDAYTRKASTPGWYFRCQICQDDFARAEEYKFHMREHGALPVYRCDLCNKTFSDSSNFAKHKKIHSLKVLICDICKKKFHAKSSLEKHMVLHEKTEPIKCKNCPKLFYTTSQYNKHVRVSHERISKFKCILCDVYFDSLRKKWDHAWAAHNERKHKADCPMCGKGFRKFLDVKLHAQAAHNVDLSFVNIKAVQERKLKKKLSLLKKMQEEIASLQHDAEDSQDSTVSLEDVESYLGQSVRMRKGTPMERLVVKLEPSEEL